MLLGVKKQLTSNWQFFVRQFFTFMKNLQFWFFKIIRMGSIFHINETGNPMGI
jgi:hypothetical protein